MALSWSTYRAIPFLRDYAAAKEHHDNIKPIRGDEHATRPVGRRDQKWFSIWESKDAIHVGYGAKALDGRNPIVTYQKSGSIIVTPHYRGASTNERLSRLTGETYKTHQYDTWVRCSFFDNGEKRHGWLPMRDGPNMLVRDGDSGLTFINYTFPKTHKIDKEKMKAKLEEYQPFLQYLRGLWKLADGALRFEEATAIECFGSTQAPWINRTIPNNPPNLRWGADKDDARALFFSWAASTDPMDQLRAAITITRMAYWGQNPLEVFQEYVIRTYKDAVLHATEHREGKFVTDRLRRLIAF